MTIEQMKDIACECFGTSKSLLDGKSRKLEVVYVKIAISNILHSKGYSLSEIGRILGLNHTTVIHHMKTVEDRLKYDSTFKKGYDNLIKLID